MKKFFKFAAVVAAAAALFSCQEKPTPDPTPDPDKPDQEQPGQTEPNENIKFTIELTDVTENTAKFKVKHDGTKADTWHYFATTESDIDQAITAEVAALAEGGKSLQTSANKNVTVRSLEPETEYTFVVFGVTTEGVVYGEPATKPFATAAEEVPVTGYTENPAWTVTYIGDYEEGGKLYEHVVTVETADSNPYFVTAWPVAMFEQYGIETIVDAEIESWKELIAQYPGATFADVVYTESIMIQVGIDPEYGTKWYAMAIGCDTNGNATGLYALSEVIDLENLGGGEEEEPTAEYAAWLGDWTFTGANGVAWPITFSKGKANKSFIMTGWEGFDDLGVVVEWDATNQIWAAMIQNLGTFEFQGGKTGDIWFAAYDAEGYFYPVDGIPAFLGGYDEEGNRVAVGYAPQDNSGNTIDFVTAGYVIDFGADQGKDQYGVLSDPTKLLTFPVTITPATKATTYAVKEFKGGKKTLNPLAPKTFKTYGLREMSYRTF